MAAGEDQPQPIVLDALLVPGGGVAGVGIQSAGELRQRCVEPGAPAHAVDGLEAAGRDEPRPRVGGYAVTRPALHGSREGVLQRLLGHVEVAQQADQRREDAARVGAVDCVHQLTHPRLVGRVLAHGYCWLNTMIGRTSTLPRRSEEHTSELQSLAYLVCRLLLEKKKNTYVI